MHDIRWLSLEYEAAILCERASARIKVTRSSVRFDDDFVARREFRWSRRPFDVGEDRWRRIMAMLMWTVLPCRHHCRLWWLMRCRWHRCGRYLCRANTFDEFQIGCKPIIIIWWHLIGHTEFEQQIRSMEHQRFILFAAANRSQLFIVRYGTVI